MLTLDRVLYNFASHCSYGSLSASVTRYQEALSHSGQSANDDHSADGGGGGTGGQRHPDVREVDGLLTDIVDLCSLIFAYSLMIADKRGIAAADVSLVSPESGKAYNHLLSRYVQLEEVLITSNYRTAVGCEEVEEDCDFAVSTITDDTFHILSKATARAIETQHAASASAVIQHANHVLSHELKVRIFFSSSFSLFLRLLAFLN
jgi:hypothetical protein